MIVINPGSGDVPSATLKNATATMRAFMKELDFDPGDLKLERVKAEDRDGRYGFLIRYEDRKVEVRMPGLPVELVRFEKARDAWSFPRLYVDGSSWLWPYALHIAIDKLDPDDEDEA